MRFRFERLLPRELQITKECSIRNDDFLAQISITILLRHCFEWLQHCSNIAALCCAQNRRCESSLVTSPLASNNRGLKFKRKPLTLARVII